MVPTCWVLPRRTTRNSCKIRPPRLPRPPPQQFKTQITSALLSQIANQVSQQIIGENAKPSGSFNLAGELVTFNRADGNININITDAGTGAQTQIVIPVPAF